MATLGDIPPTDEFLRPILETLRVQDAPMPYRRLVDALYGSLGLSTAGSQLLRDAFLFRINDALRILEGEKAVQGTGWFMLAWKRWTITEYGRGLEDQDFASAFDKYAFGPSLPLPEPPPGFDLRGGA